MTPDQNALIREFIGIALGEASMCWDPAPGNQIFDSTRASKIHERLFSLFEENIEAARNNALNQAAHAVNCLDKIAISDHSFCRDAMEVIFKLKG